MEDISQERGHGEEQKPVLAHQDEFGHKAGNDYAANDGSGYGGVSESERPRHKIHTSDEFLPKPSAGYGDGGLQEEHGEESYAPAEESTPQTSQSGLEGKTASYGTTGATLPDREEESHEATTGYGAPAAGSTIDEDTSAKHGAKKEGFMSKLKEKLPGHHKSTDATAYDAPTDTASPTTPPKKGFVTKLKEKLPGQHDSSTDM